MHFEVLVEEQSGKKALEILIPKILGEKDTFRVHAYKGIGHIPKNLQAKGDPQKRILLDQLPRLLQSYGKTFAGYSETNPAAVILICDLDAKCLKTFRKELLDILNKCNPMPLTRFCIAIEEGEAWLLGDLPAIYAAYPKAKAAVLTSYVNDSICGTWELLANAVFKGGAKALAGKGWHAVGAEKNRWAENICPNMDPFRNASPSFNYFRNTMQSLLETGD